MKRRLLFLPLLAAPYCVGLSPAGCSDSPSLTLVDASQGCREGALGDRSVALGARLDVRATRAGAAPRIRTVTANDEQVLRVVAIDNPFALRATNPGRTRITAADDTGATGFVELIVEEVAKVALVPSPLTAWNFDTRLAVRHPTATEPLTGAGFALLPDGKIRVDVRLEAAGGNELIGYDLVSWQADLSLVALADAEARRQDREVSHRGTPGETVLRTDAGGRFALGLLPAGGIQSLAAYFPETGVVGGPIAVRSGEAVTVVLVARDATGRFVVGNGAAGLTAEVAASGSKIAAIVDPPWARPAGEIDLDAAGRALLARSRVLYLRGLDPGSTTLSLGAGGKRLDLTVNVTR